ncbi:MAG: hypothetical protein J5965_09070 [Aeriscardovia sp.]|nr:hypothetical protein [Aeriscardovia sp.]
MDAYAVSIDEYIKDGKKITVLQTFPEIDYALLIREAKYQPFVAAYGWDEQNVSWNQGHYFSSIINACLYIQQKLAEKTKIITPMRMQEIAEKSMSALREADEDAYEDLCYDLDLTEMEREYFEPGEEDEDDED